MTAHDREVAGIRCTAVMAELSDYLDRELSGARRAQIEAHVRGCDWCERFGGEFAAVVGALRRQLGVADEPETGVRRRLRERLAGEVAP